MVVVKLLKLNNIEYKKAEKCAVFDSYDATITGVRKKGKALYMSVSTDKFLIGIETVYDLEWIREFKMQEERDISKYIVGLEYEDERGFLYLSNKCYCTLCRISADSFKIFLDGSFEERGEKFDIEYIDDFKINS